MMTKRQILVQFFQQNKMLVGLTLGSGFIANLLSILLPVSLGKYFLLMFGTGARRAAYLDWLPSSWLADVPSFLIFFFAMVTIRTVFHFGQRYGSGLLGERFAKQIREQLFHHQLRVQTSVYDQSGIGKYLLRYSGDMQSLQNYLTKGVLEFIIDVMLLIIAVAFMAKLSLPVLGVTLGGFALTAGLVFLMNKRLSRVTELRRGARSKMLGFVSERLHSAVTLKAFNKEVPEFMKFEKKSSGLYRLGVSFQRIYGLIFALVPGLIYGALGLTLTMIYLLNHNGHSFDGASMLAFVLLFITILPVLRRMFRANSVWEMGNISFRKLNKVLKLEAETGGLPAFKFKKGKIEMRNVGFGFSKKKQLLHSLNLTIQPGKITVLEAPEGFGKSTLVKLILGIYPVSEGEILVDGQDIGKLDLKTLRRSITAVSDGFSLLGETVFEAISYSRKPEKRPKAAKILEALQAGVPSENCLTLDQKIGEHAIKLSAGQRKLMQYARAFLSEKPILLVDEPFTDLSIEARINVVRCLTEKRMVRTTVLLVSSWKEGWLQEDKLIALGRSRNLHEFQF